MKTVKIILIICVLLLVIPLSFWLDKKYINWQVVMYEEVKTEDSKQFDHIVASTTENFVLFIIEYEDGETELKKIPIVFEKPPKSIYDLDFFTCPDCSEGDKQPYNLK